MELKQGTNLQINSLNNPNSIIMKKGILLDNLSNINKIENLFIIDLYNICSEQKEKTDLDMIKYFEIVKEYSIYDENFLYLFFHSSKQSELIENTKSINEIFQNNIFLEEKVTIISFITGFFIAKNIPVFLFTDGINQIGNWIKIKDPTYEKNLKVSELDYFRITLDYMLKDKKRKFEQDIIKANKNKLSKILEESSMQTSNNENKIKEVEVKLTLKNILDQKINNNLNTKDKNDFTKKKRTNLNNIASNNAMNNKSSTFYNTNKNHNHYYGNNSKENIYLANEKTRKEIIEEYLSSYKFLNFLNKIKKYIYTNPPKNFEILKNILQHFSEQNIISINNYLKESCSNNTLESIKVEELSFFILKELLKKEFLLNKKFCDLVNSNIVNNLDEISTILNFHINLNFNMNNINNPNSKEEEILKESNGNNPNLIYVKSNDNEKTKFSIGNNSEEEYKNLIINCQSICFFVKNVICKVLNSINLSCLDKLPTNPSKYKNYIFSFVNNQELFKISKKILNIDYNNIVNIITDGIILEFIKNNLIVFLSDKKIHYNLPEIEKEKFRLMNFKQKEETKNSY